MLYVTQISFAWANKHSASENSQISKFIEIKQKSTKYQPLTSEVKV